MIGTGTLLNAGTIIAGSVIGVMIHSRLPQKMVNTIFQGMGLVTAVIGISMSLKSDNFIIIVISVVLGIIVGEWIDIDKYVRRFSDYLINKGQQFGSKSKGESKNKKEGVENRFTEGFVTASMLFCVGSMAILGSIEDGMGNEPNLLITKSVIDEIGRAHV